MITETELAWKIIHRDLELLKAEEPSSLVPLMVSLNQLVCPETFNVNGEKLLQFMCYELQSRCEPYEAMERLLILNDYFFGEKAFHISSLQSTNSREAESYIIPCLENRDGSPLVIASLYTHLANLLDLPVYIVHLRDHILTKWVESEIHRFIDLQNGGKFVADDVILQKLHLSCRMPDMDRALEIIPPLRLFKKYLCILATMYRDQTNMHREKTVLDIQLQLEPTEATFLGRRALLNHRLGYTLAADGDFKRYFAFVERSHASPELQLAFKEIEALNQLVNETLH